MALFALVAIFAVAVPEPAHAATIQQTKVFGVGSGGFRFPQNATNISVTIAGGEGFGVHGEGGKGGSMTFTLSQSFAGHPMRYTVGAAGDVETADNGFEYRGGGGGSALSSLDGSLLVVVGGGGGSGGSLAGPFNGGDGGVVDFFRFDDGDGSDGGGPGSTSGDGGQQGQSGGLAGPSRGGSGGILGGQPGEDSILPGHFPPGSDYGLADGGAPGVAGEFESCGGGGGGYAGGGGGGNSRDGCGGGGGGSGVLEAFSSSFGQTARGLNSGDGSLTISFSVPELVVTPPTLPTAQVGTRFVTDPVTVTGGATGAGNMTGYRFAIDSGALPDGVFLDPASGRIGGTPTVSGDFSFTLGVTDDVSPAPQTVEVPLVLTVQPAPLALTPTADTAAKVGQPLSWSPAAVTGGTAPYTWAIASGTIPAGTTFDTATGIVGGIPTTAGTSNVAVRVTDSAIPPQRASSSSATLQLTTTPISAPATVREGASAAVSASGLVAGDYTIDLDGTDLATTTVPASGDLASSIGIPLDATLGSHVISVLYQGVEVGRTTTTVASTTLAATPLTLPDAVRGTPYSGSPISATGGLAPLTYSSTDVPAGLAIDPATALITGTPSASGTFTMHVDVQDAETPAQAATVTTTLQVAVAPLDLHVVTPPAQAHVGMSFTATPVTVSGGTAPYAYALGAGQSLPDGLVLDPATGGISGTATTSSTNDLTIVVTDSSPSPQTASAPFTLTISQLTIDATTPVPLGGTIVVSGEGFDPGSYDVVLHSDPVTLGAATVGAGGVLRFSGTIPGAAGAGVHQVQVVRAGLLVATTSITVTAAASAPSSPALAGTGVDPTSLWMLGVALLVAGGIAAAAGTSRTSRRRRE